MKEDHERVSNLLADTVTLLCRNGLQFKTEMKVQGLLGITLDDEVFLVQIDKKFSEMMGAELVSIQAEKDRAADLEDGGSDDSRAAPSRHRNRHRKKRRRTNEAGENSPASSLKESKVLIKSEPIQDDDDLILMESDTKPGIHDKNTMRQSYGMQYDNGLPSGSNQNLSNNDSPYITNIIKNSSQGMDDSQLGGDAGCSTWDGQISALTAGDGGSVLPHGGNSSGGDETLDQQTMSTFRGAPLGMMYSPRMMKSILRRPVQDAEPMMYSRSVMESILRRPVREPEPDAVVSQDQDDRLWQCKVCDKSYYSRRNLTCHLQKKHGIKEVDSSHKVAYKCNVPDCKRSYNRRDNLLAHKRRHHGISTPPRSVPNSMWSSNTPEEHGFPTPQTSVPISQLKRSNSPEEHGISTTPMSVPISQLKRSNTPEEHGISTPQTSDPNSQWMSSNTLEEHGISTPPTSVPNSQWMSSNTREEHFDSQYSDTVI